MTLPAGTPNRNDYVGNDSLAIYPFTYPIQNQLQLKVWVINIATGVWVNGGNSDGSLIYNTDYTVAGEGSPGGGTIELVNNSQAWLDASTGFLNTGWNMVIRMYPGLSQGTSFGNGGPFYEEALDALADTLTMQDLEQQDEIDRSIKLPPVDNPSGYTLTIPELNRATQVIGFDATGKIIQLYPSNATPPTLPASLTTLEADSATLTPSASGNWTQTSVKITLTPGTWEIFGHAIFTGAGDPLYTKTAIALCLTDGANSSSAPTVITTKHGNNVSAKTSTGAAFVAYDDEMNLQAIQVVVAVNTDVYLVPFANMTTAAYSRINTYLWAVLRSTATS